MSSPELPLLIVDPVLFLGLGAFFLLLVSTVYAFWAVGGTVTSSINRVLVAISNLFLAAQLIIRWFDSGHFPVSNLYESLCFLTWCITLTHLLVERSFPSPLISAVISPFSLLTIAFASFALPDQLQQASPLVPALRSSWLVMHVTVIMCSYSALFVGSLLSGVVLFVDKSQSLQIRGNSIGIGSFRTEHSKNTIPDINNPLNI